MGMMKVGILMLELTVLAGCRMRGFTFRMIMMLFYTGLMMVSF